MTAHVWTAENAADKYNLGCCKFYCHSNKYVDISPDHLSLGYILTYSPNSTCLLLPVFTLYRLLLSEQIFTHNEDNSVVECEHEFFLFSKFQNSFSSTLAGSSGKSEHFQSLSVNYENTLQWLFIRNICKHK